jgi:hypothetical protein
MTVRLTCFALIFFAAPVNAALVHMAWSEQGEFQHQQAIEAGGYAEVCGALGEDERIAWAFEASGALDFNIHYHEDEKVIYPVEAAASEALADILVVAIAQTYCWMWTNQKDQPVQLNLQLSRDTPGP